jgi:hypothetical protein
MRSSLFVLMIAIALIACSHNLREEFDESLKKYNDLFRWNALDAASTFAADSVREDFIARTKSAKNVRIIDSRIMSEMYDETKRKASVDVEIEYYILSSVRVKTIHVTEEWGYLEQKGVKGWRLMSLFPEFR